MATVRITWKPEKNEWLKRERDLSFEQIEVAIAEGYLAAVLENKNHKNQVILVVEIDDYMIAVPAIIKGKVYFFMTAYPSRVFSKKYRRKKCKTREKLFL
jgi:hypothetical protein